MEIRAAVPGDVEQICRLYDAFFAYNAKLQPEYYSPAKEIGNYPKSVIKSESADILIAVESGAVVGFLHIRKARTPSFDAIVPHGYAEIIDFFVTDSHREKGIGSALMEAAKQWGKVHNLDYIELFALSNAHDALRFYEQRDFTTVSHTMRCML